MRRLLLVLSIIVALAPSLPVKAQIDETTPIQNGCRPEVIEVIEPIAENLDYAEACRAYEECARENPIEIARICDLYAVDSLLSSCLPQNTTCRANALLHAATIRIFGAQWSYSARSVKDLLGDVSLALEAFQREDYATSLEIYGRLVPIRVAVNALPLSYAIVEEQLGQLENALETYANILNGYPDQPFIYYARAHLYGMLGRTIEASFDAERIRQYAEGEPELTELVTALIEAYPLDSSQLEDWLYYPILTTGISPGGIQAVDITQSPASPIRLVAYDELDSIFVLGLERNLVGSMESPMRADVLRLSSFEDSYHFSWDSIYWGSEVVDLAAHGTIFVGTQIYSEGEGSSRRMFLLAPAGEPDPRLYLHGERCSGGVLSRLRPGMQALPRWFMSIPLLDNPGGVEIYASEEPVTILPEMDCRDGIMWWQAITSDGIVGWVQENEGDEYQLIPYSTSQTAQIPFDCPDVPQIRLVVDGAGTVIPGMGVNNIRAEPNTNAPVVASIPPEATLTITNGPVCADGFVWWEVDYEGNQGWTAEGEGDTYWLAPVLDFEISGASG